MYWRRHRRGPLKDFEFDEAIVAHCTVCIQCPVYNEPEFICDLLDHVTEIEWPEDLFEVQILDDSDDVTTSRIIEWMAAHPQKAKCVQHIRRKDRLCGYKAGSLAHGLAITDADFITIFDTDFRPENDFLIRMMPHFADSNIDAVQARWAFKNRNQYWTSLLQAVLLEPHFFVEQSCRCDNELFLTFNGTAGIWRRSAIDAAGGWSNDTITEDFDLSFRVQLQGGKILYLQDYAVSSELPLSLTAFKAQQFRWTKGTMQTFRKFMWTVLRSDQPLRVKVESIHQLGIGFFHPVLMVTIFLNIPTIIIQLSNPSPSLGIAQFLTTVFTFGSAFIYFLMGQYLHHRCLWKSTIMFFTTPFFLSAAMALCLTTALASIKGIYEDSGEFVKTQKDATPRSTDLIGDKSNQQNILLPLFGEITLGTAFLIFSLALFAQDHPVLSALIAIQSFGLLLFASTTIKECYGSRMKGILASVTRKSQA